MGYFAGSYPTQLPKLPLKSKKSIFHEIFEAQELAVCPNSNLYKPNENDEHIALIFQVFNSI